jgi:hypothetical protein
MVRTTILVLFFTCSVDDCYVVLLLTLLLVSALFILTLLFILKLSEQGHDFWCFCAAALPRQQH